ncbi:MAG: hypothetical protein ACRCZB_08085 [Bacteroidales bacterium]
MLKDRILEFIRHLGISVLAFENSCQLKRSNISTMTGALGTDKVEKIILKYPQLSPDWLLTGKGSMLRSEANAVETASPTVDKLIAIIESQQRTIESLIKK